MTTAAARFQPVKMSLLEFDAPPSGAERFEKLLEGTGFKLQRIVSSQHASPDGFWYDQPEAEWVMVIAGQARLRFAEPDSCLDLGPGDCVEIPAGCRHRVDWTCDDQPTVWLALHHDS